MLLAVLWSIGRVGAHPGPQLRSFMQLAAPAAPALSNQTMTLAAISANVHLVRT